MFLERMNFVKWLVGVTRIMLVGHRNYYMWLQYQSSATNFAKMPMKALEMVNIKDESITTPFVLECLEKTLVG